MTSGLSNKSCEAQLLESVQVGLDFASKSQELVVPTLAENPGKKGRICRICTLLGSTNAGYFQPLWEGSLIVLIL